MSNARKHIVSVKVWRLYLATTRHILELMMAVLKKWEAGARANGLEVIPVLVPDLAAHRELIAAIVQQAGGAFIDVGDCYDGVESDGDIDERLRSVITSSLKIRVAGREREVDVHLVEGKARATIDGRENSESESSGIGVLLNVASSLFHNQLNRTTLAVISYNESGLSGDIADKIWDLFTIQLIGVKVGKLYTLVVFVEAPSVQMDRHCVGGTSLAFFVGPDGVEERNTREANFAEIRRIPPGADDLLVLFLGAGFSASSGLPLGDRLRDRALRRLFDSAHTVPELIDMFRGYVESYRRWFAGEQDVGREEFRRDLTLERVLREEVHRWGATGSPTLRSFQELNEAALKRRGLAVLRLHELMRRKRNLVVATVNFDTLVESIGGPDDVWVAADVPEFEGFAARLAEYRRHGGPVPVLKLHGTIERLETIVATVDQTAQGLAERKIEAIQALAHAGGLVRWVYIGYSMRDPDVTAVLAPATFHNHVDEFWVSPFAVPTARSFANNNRAYEKEGKPVFHSRSITETADSFLAELSKCWTAE